MKWNNKGFTLIEILAVVVIIAVIMILVIPNILGTMKTTKKQALKEYAMKSFNEAQKLYESEEFSKIQHGSSDSDFQTNTYGYVITLSTLESIQDKYKGCVLIAPGNNNEYFMFIYITDGDYMYKNVIKSEIKDTEPQANTLPKNETSIVNGIVAPSIP